MYNHGYPIRKNNSWHIQGFQKHKPIPEEAKMVSAIVLIECEKGTINETAEMLADMKGISEVYSVAGQVDLVAVIRVADNEGLAEIVTNKMLHVPGIARTETLIAFRVFSRHDLESMFSIGLDGD
jgi:DNA-binding Lrp family transcriptional regulator